MTNNLESDIANLLTELAVVQGELLKLLNEKRQILVSRDNEALSEIGGREQNLIDRLQACFDSRQQLLDQASDQGLPADSILALSESLPSDSRDPLKKDIQKARSQSRLIQHQSLTNWVLVQRTLLHLSQLIEIIATGGQMKPTYGNGADRLQGGTLVDQAV